MSGSADWNAIESALDELLALEGDARERALESLHRRDPAVGAEVSSLLRYAEGGDARLDRPAADSVGAVAGDSVASGRLAPGTRIGAYTIERLVGRGGMGEVYLAVRADGAYRADVALKLLRRDAVGQLSRFETERQILADLSHPGIARLLDGGVTGGSEPYMVMEYVEGEDIIGYCRRVGADLAARLALFNAACEATAYAHRHLVIHRDLKPGNVLVTPDGTVKLLDFGAAKLLRAEPADHTLHAPLTPRYAAPEQLTGGAVSTATDVYALGLLLFELLTGERPHGAGDSLAATVSAVVEGDAPRLSAAAARNPEAPVESRLLEGDLDAIVAKALRREPERRYATVDALQDDLARYASHRPVAARAGRRAYVIGRALRRNALLAASIAAVLVALAAGTVTTALQARAARAEAAKAEAVKRFLVEIFKNSSVNNPDGAAARNVTAGELLDRGARAVASNLHQAPAVRAEVIDTLADLYDQLESFDQVESLERLRLADLAARDGNRPTMERAQAHAELGRALAMGDRYEEASRELGGALADLDAVGDTHSAARVQALTFLGMIEYRTRPVTDPAAMDHTAAALALLERNDPTSPDRLSAAQLLARIHWRRHEAAAAEAAFRDFIALSETPAFRDQPVALGAGLTDLADFLAERQRFGESELAIRRAIEVLDRAEGADRMTATGARVSLARLLVRKADDAAAEALFNRCRGTRIAMGSGEVYSLTAPIDADLAQLAAARGDYGAARRLYGQVLKGEATNPAGSAPLRATVNGHYARMLLEQGALAEAEAALAASEALYESLHDTEAAGHAANAVTRADLEIRAGHVREAAATYDAVRARHVGGGELDEAYVSAVLGSADLALARHDAASAVRALEALVAEIGAKPDRAYFRREELRARLKLGEALTAAGRRRDGLAEFDTVVSLARQSDGRQLVEGLRAAALRKPG